MFHLSGKRSTSCHNSSCFMMSSLRKHADTRETAPLYPTQPNDEDNQPHTDLRGTPSSSAKAIYSERFDTLFESILGPSYEVGTIPPKRRKSKTSTCKPNSKNKYRKLTEKAPPASTTFSRNDTLPSRGVMLHATTDNQQLSSHDSSRAINGMNGASAGGVNGSSSMPINAGQQMDLNFIYSKVLELSEQLRVNREQTQGLIAGAEELAVGLFRCFQRWARRAV